MNVILCFLIKRFVLSQRVVGPIDLYVVLTLLYHVTNQASTSIFSRQILNINRATCHNKIVQFVIRIKTNCKVLNINININIKTSSILFFLVVSVKKREIFRRVSVNFDLFSKYEFDQGSKSLCVYLTRFCIHV